MAKLTGEQREIMLRKIESGEAPSRPNVTVRHDQAGLGPVWISVMVCSLAVLCFGIVCSIVVPHRSVYVGKHPIADALYASGMQGIAPATPSSDDVSSDGEASVAQSDAAVIVTIPPALANGVTQSGADMTAERRGWAFGRVLSDGSVEYGMSEAQRDTMLQSLQQTLDSTMESYLSRSDLGISSIEHSEDWLSFSVRSADTLTDQMSRRIRDDLARQAGYVRAYSGQPFIMAEVSFSSEPVTESAQSAPAEVTDIPADMPDDAELPGQDPEAPVAVQEPQPEQPAEPDLPAGETGPDVPDLPADLPAADLPAGEPVEPEGGDALLPAGENPVVEGPGEGPADVVEPDPVPLEDPAAVEPVQDTQPAEVQPTEQDGAVGAVPVEDG